MRRFLLAAAMTAGLLVSVPAVASADTFVPVRLTVWDTEDYTGADEVELRYGNGQWNKSLNTGQYGFPDSRTFSGSMVVEAWEMDLGVWFDPHDFIGSAVIGSWEKGWGERSVHFTSHGAHYELRYRVE